METEEIYKDIPGYEGRYQISNLGNVKSLIRKGKFLSQSDNGRGYLKVRLFDNENKAKTWKVHRLVMLTFVGESEMTVNHKNGVKSDNRLDNLEYLSNEQNIKQAYHNSLIGLGNEHIHSKLSEGAVLICRASYAAGMSGRELARYAGVSEHTMRRIINRKTWQHI